VSEISGAIPSCLIPGVDGHLCHFMMLEILRRPVSEDHIGLIFTDRANALAIIGGVGADLEIANIKTLEGMHSQQSMRFFCTFFETVYRFRTVTGNRVSLVSIAKAKNEALALYLQGDEGAAHPSHTLRFPGSYNCKYIPKKLVTVQVFEKRYDISKFDFLKTPKITKVEAPKTIKAVGFDKIKRAAHLCPVIDTAINAPESLSFPAWLSIACLTDEESFVKISALDKERFSEKESLQMYRYLKNNKYRPYGCNKIPEAKKCPRLGKCGLRKVIYE